MGWRTLIVLGIGLAAGAVIARDYKTIIHFARDFLVSAGVMQKPLSPRIAKGRDAMQLNPLAAPCPDPKRERVAVLLTAGQSNASNDGAIGEPKDADNAAILNLWQGKCFVARHPVLGATGEHQSPWIETARLLLASGKFDKIVIIATGIGGTGMAEWAPGGEFHQRLLDRIAEAKDAGLTPTHFLWHQGEHDAVNKKSPADYLTNIKSLVAAVRAQSNVPVVLALATRCAEHGPYEPIREAQRLAAQELPNTLIVDSDALGLAYRYDGCHMTKEGQNELARLYAENILGP